MLKNYLQIKNIMHTISTYSKSIFLKKLESKKIYVILLLMLFNFGYSQLALENFNTGIPASWAITSNIAVTNNWSPTPAGGYQATGGAFVNPALNNTVGSTREYFMITPQFLTPSNGQIRFFTKQGSFTNRGTTYQLRISTASQPDVTSFNVVLQSWTETQLNVSATTYEEKIVDISSITAGIPVYVAFVAVTNQLGTAATSGDSWFVDNVRVIPACTPVTGITTTIGPDNAVINWTHPFATQFGIEVVAQGAGHGTTGTPVTGTTYTANGLTSNTSYDVYIITNCDATTNSTWAGPFTITTVALGFACTTPLVIPPDLSAAPYVLSTNLNTFHDNINYVPYTSQGLSCVPPSTPSTWNWFSGDHAFLSYTPSTTGLINISQTVSNTTGGGCFPNTLSSVFIFDSCAGVGTNASCLGSITTGNPSSVLTGSLNNFYVQAGQTYIFLISSPYQQTTTGASICFTFVISAPTCPIPSDLSFQNLLENSATFSWANPQNLVSQWQYVAIPASLGAPNGTETLTTTNSNLNNLLSGLTPGTAYNFYVRSVCSGTPGPWSSPLPFTTQCNALPLPFYTGFTNATTTNPEPCWSILNLNNDAYSFTFGNNANSEPCARLRTGDADPNDMLVTPRFIFDGVTQKRLRFKYMVYGSWGPSSNPTPGPGSFEVLLSTNGAGGQNFTTVLEPLASYVTGYNFIEKIIPIPANIVGNVNIAFKLPAGAVQTGIQFYIDDVYIEDLPACSEPSYPVVTPGSITTTSATISWTNGYNNTQWELVAQPINTGIPTTPGVIVNTNPFTLTGLIPSTKYEFYMRAVCSPTINSAWAGPINFNTLCIGQFDPYYESFNDDDANSKKFCWSVNNPGADITMWRIEATEASIRAISTFSTPFVSFDDWLISVPITSTGQKRLRFDYRAATQFNYPIARGNFEVLMSPTSNFSTYTTLIPSHDFLNSNYLEDSVIFTATGTFYIAFRVPPTMVDPGNSGIIMLDNVRIEDVPLCPNPSDLTVTAITTTTANLAWTVGSTETQWQIAIQNQGSGVPTGSGLTVNTTPAYNATGLTPDTAYEYYVRAICQSPDISDWIGPIPFRTTCNALPTPFLETFDSNSTTESCWRSVNANGDGYYWNLNQPVNPIFGDQMAALFTGTNGNNNDWLITPTLMAHAGQRLRFYFKSYSDFFEEDLKVMLSINGAATNQFTTTLYENNFSANTNATGIVTGSNTITLNSVQDVRVGDFIYIADFPFPYPTYVAAVNGTLITMTTSATITQSGPQAVVFTHEVLSNTVTREFVINLTDITSPTNINLAFHTPFYPPNPWAYRGQLTFIDNVIVEDIPVCPSVINVTASNIIDTSVSINWQEVGSATSWQISMQPYGTPAPVGNTLPLYLTTTTTHPKTISGLTPATQYQYYIRAICSGSSQSEWVGPFEFTTRCDFANVCQYTITTISGNSGQVTQSVNVMQNGVIVQELEFPGFGQTTLDYTVFLCSGVAFDLYWLGQGSGVQYNQAQIIIKDEFNNIVWTSPLGLGSVNTNIYTGFASCGVITCPQPTNLTSNNQGALSWTPGGTETQWEVFIQPLANGTLPVSGHIVSSPTYTPIASDFTESTSGTYEYFVRAICGPTNTSFWSGPKTFIRNDEPANAIRLQINAGENCVVSGKDASFIGATASTTPTTCAGVNGGDIWYDFVATSKVHIIELSDFAPGSYYSSAYVGIWPKIIMSLYEVQANGSLVEKGCSENNSMVTIYSTELVLGTTYKIRLKLNDVLPNIKKFHICITTPTDVCNLNAFNYSFEKLPMQSVTGIPTILNATVIPGWRVNTTAGQMFFNEASNSPGVIPYEGGQCVQLVHDNSSTWNATDPNIKGLYKDFDTSEITQMDYSFASASRTNGTTLQLFAGPPSGPFTLVTEHLANSLIWQIIQGNYMIPVGQNTTRFIFRVKNYAIGHLLDAANFKPNTDIITANTTLACPTTSILVEAQGVGEWIADTSNPAITIIATPNVKSTTISGFNTPGVYIYHWRTRYCDKTITITFQGINTTPTVVSPALYCLNAIATPLSPTVPNGFTLMWYTVPVGGTGNATAPTPNTATLGNTGTYYVSAVDTNGCEGPRSLIVIQVNDIPTAIISGTTTICSGSTATITFSGTPNATVTYTVDSGANQTITLNAAGTASITTASLSVNSTYSLVSSTSAGANSCTQTQTGSAILTVISPPIATISGNTTICSGNTSTINFNGTPNATVTYTINSGANQTIILNSSGVASITTSSLNTSVTYSLVSAATAGTPTCAQNQTGTATITVINLPIASISGTTTICSGSTATITFSGTPNATITYTIDSGANQTITLNASGTATITSPSLTTNSTYTLVSVASAGTTICSQAQSGTAVVSIVSLPTATISGTATICSGGTATITFNGTPNAIVTYTVNSGANQTITLNGTGNGTITTPALTINNTYTLVSVALNGTSPCSQSQTGSAIITINSLPIASISGTTTICSGSTATITFSGTPNATVTYTIDSGANQTITLDDTGSATITTPALTTNSAYALVSVASAGTPSCSQNQSGSAVVSIATLPIASISGTTTICSGSTTTITFSGTPNATITYTVDSGANQTIILNSSGAATITTPALTTNSTYALVSVASAGTLSCSQNQSGSAIVTVTTTLPTATISGTTTICSGSTATITLSGTPNATVTYTIDSGANQTITLNSSGTGTITTPTLTTTSTYALVSVASAGTPSCSQNQSGSAVVSIATLPIASISGTTTICSGSTATITFSGTPNATVTYIVDSGANQTITLDDTGAATITTTALTTTSTYTLVNVASAGTPSCSQNQSGSAVVSITTLPIASISGTTTICSGSTATITFSGTPNATVSYTVDSGANQTITLDGSGNATITTPALTANSTYTLVSVASAGTLSCSQNQSGSAIVTVTTTLPTATISGTTTICSGNTATITFSGTPNATVTYTVDSGANQTITLNSSGTATITTPTLTTASTYALVSVASAGTPSCSQNQSGSAVVSITTLPIASISGTTTICTGGTTTITFNGTPNATITYTVDSGSNQTITLDGSGNATITTPSLTINSTYSLVSVASEGTVSCSQNQSGSAVVSIATLPIASILGTTSICSGSTATITFNGTPNATITYTVDSGANQTITLDGSGNAALTTPALTATSAYALVSVASVGTPSCSQNQSGSAIVTVTTTIPTATISGTTTICSGSTATITFSGTPNATVTYTVDSGANQTITLDGSGNATLTTPALTATSTYALVSVASAGTPSCSQNQSGSAVVSVATLPIASISGTTTICTGSTATITFNGTPNATITYTVDSGANQTITLDGSGNATITTPTLTTTSTYALVSVALAGTPSCSQNQSGSVVISIAPLPIASISGTTTICSGSTATITFSGTPNATITYIVDSGANQTITLNSAGTATITTPALTTTSTYTLVSVASAGTLSCSQNQSGSVVISIAPLPIASISGTTTICSGSTATISFNGTPNATVTYTVDSGANQTIILNGSGNATITTPALTSNSTYALVSVASTGTPSCSQNQLGSAIVTVNVVVLQNFVFSYAQACLNATTNPSPILTSNFTSGGLFSSTSLTVNATTGVINLASATIGAHQITYTLAPNPSSCIVGGSYTTTIQIVAGFAPITSFDYDTTYCSDVVTALPTTATGFSSGGLFSSTSGLQINASTGAINSSQSTPGTYTITYTVQANSASCNTGGSSSDIVTIAAPINVIINDICQDQLLILESEPVNNSYNPNSVTYSWNDGNTTVGNSSTLNIDDYFTQHPLASFPITFTVTVTSNGCNGIASFTVRENPCKLIPRGISPNGDGDNDTFDLNGLGVKELIIFNRYGTKVYSFRGRYTNQWTGLTDNGNDLPDGTYFYNIVKNNDETVVGWVYINK